MLVITGCGNWAKYAREAQARQEADEKEAEAEAMSQGYQLRSELLILKASQLCARASQADLDAALDAVDPKLSFVKLVIVAETEIAAPRLSVSSNISVGSRFNVGILVQTAGDATGRDLQGELQ